MIFALIVGTFLGNYLEYPALRNTSYVFTALYILAKTADFGDIFWKNQIRCSYSIFVICILCYALSLYLHKHPSIMVDIFKWETSMDQPIQNVRKDSEQVNDDPKHNNKAIIKLE